MDRSFPWLHGVVAQLPAERGAGCRVGFGLMGLSGAFAFFVYATVYGHPEQDLPLWPAWIFTGLALVGLVIGLAAVVPLRPFRPRPPSDEPGQVQSR